MAFKPFDHPVPMEYLTTFDAGVVDPTLPDQSAGLLHTQAEHIRHAGDIQQGRVVPHFAAVIRSDGHNPIPGVLLLHMADQLVVVTDNLV